MTSIIKHAKWIAIGCAALAAGCQNNTPKPAESASIRGDVTDIRPMESTAPAYQPAPIQTAYQPAPAVAQPVSYDAPASTPMGGTIAGGNSHVVKRGETLYSIARQSYGDGKQWQKIASANPGVTPSTLKVGQTLIIP